MTLIIDGYNLLNAAGVASPGGSGSSLARSRTALLDFLADRLTTSERRATTVVFDGRHAPPGLEPVVRHRGITVRFARPDLEADDVIEELIQRNTAPRRLTVVSSDHRLHRAARRSRAAPVDSDVWFRQIAQQPIQGEQSVDMPDQVEAELACRELDEWLRTFGEGAVEAQQRPAPPKPRSEPATSSDFDSPFPPGYAEDLLRDEAS
jgi:uncharacterized protein